MIKRNYKRWKIAQQYEQNWWENYHVDIQWYRDVALDIEKLVTPFIKLSENTHILEIGAGPCGSISFFKSNYRYAIEPLNEFFSREYADVRDSQVKYQKGVGEELPYENCFFDLLIIDNVIDHCLDPEKVICEMKRVLKRGGIIFLRIHIYHEWGVFIRKIMELLLIDKGHPHSLTLKKLRNVIKNQNLKIIQLNVDSFLKRWLADIRMKSVRSVLKSLLFVTSVDLTMLLKKE